MAKVKMCKYCKEHRNNSQISIYFDCLEDDDYSCPNCGNGLTDTTMESEDSIVLFHISPDETLLEAMIALKEKDPIEFHLKMSQFKASLSQQSKTKEEKRTNQVICPYCRSDNTRRISGISKAASVAMLGMYAIVERSRQWHCNNCNSDF